MFVRGEILVCWVVMGDDSGIVSYDKRRPHLSDAPLHMKQDIRQQRQQRPQCQQCQQDRAIASRPATSA